MKLVPLLLALVLAATAGCTGLPAGSADFGDTVNVRYSVMDDNGNVLRTERTATFALGSGASGLGLGFERALRGALPGENLTFTIHDDPSLRFGKTVEVARDLSAIQKHQSAPRNDFESNVGPAGIGQQFAAFGIYTATVTAVTANEVSFLIETRDNATQRDPVASVGAILVSTPDATQIHRRLDPDVGRTFVISPPSQFSPQTPLGLAPGSYRTEGATDDKIVYAFSTSGALDLVGRSLSFNVAIVRIVAGDHEVEPVDGNYVARPTPYVNGDPTTVLTGTSTSAGHTH